MTKGAFYLRCLSFAFPALAEARQGEEELERQCSRSVQFEAMEKAREIMVQNLKLQATLFNQIFS